MWCIGQHEKRMWGMRTVINMMTHVEGFVARPVWDCVSLLMAKLQISMQQ